MGKLHIQEYLTLGGSEGGGAAQVGLEPAITSQEVTTSGVSAQSAAFNKATRFVRLQSDTNVRVRFGTDPVATGSDLPLSAGSPQHFGVVPGCKLAAVE